jgi:hypothetical protein
MLLAKSYFLVFPNLEQSQFMDKNTAIQSFNRSVQQVSDRRVNTVKFGSFHLHILITQTDKQAMYADMTAIVCELDQSVHFQRKQILAIECKKLLVLRINNMVQFS